MVMGNIWYKLLSFNQNDRWNLIFWNIRSLLNLGMYGAIVKIKRFKQWPAVIFVIDNLIIFEGFLGVLLWSQKVY